MSLSRTAARKESSGMKRFLLLGIACNQALAPSELLLSVVARWVLSSVSKKALWRMFWSRTLRHF